MLCIGGSGVLNVIEGSIELLLLLSLLAVSIGFILSLRAMYKGGAAADAVPNAMHVMWQAPCTKNYMCFS